MATEVNNIAATLNTPQGLGGDVRQLLDRQEAALQRVPATNTDTNSRKNGQEAGDNAASADKRNELNKAVEDLNSHYQILRRNLQFTIDEGSGKTVIKVTDSDTEEVIRQIPAEETLALARSLEKAEGLIFQAKA